jgi:hypothetical protein
MLTAEKENGSIQFLESTCDFNLIGFDWPSGDSCGYFFVVRREKRLLLLPQSKKAIIKV